MPPRRMVTERAQGDLVNIGLISFLLQSGNSFFSQNFCPPQSNHSHTKRDYQGYQNMSFHTSASVSGWFRL